MVAQLSSQCAEFAASLKELKQYQAALDLLFRAKLYISSKQADEPSSNSSSSLSSPLSGSASSLPSATGSGSDENKDAKDKDDPAVILRHEKDAVKLQILFEMGSISTILSYLLTFFLFLRRKI